MNFKSLWFIGLACMAGGGIASVVVPKPADHSDAIAQDLGYLTVMLIGVVLIITHFVRQKKTGR
jgi:hypothetical protein